MPKNKFISLVLLFFIIVPAAKTLLGQTTVSIVEDQFFINGEITYKDRIWKGHKIEGLLLNSRMVQGIFDDLNPATRKRFIYSDTKIWDANRNTVEFVSAMKDWHDHGLLAFTLNLQGGSPMGYGNEGWVNSTFDGQGNLRLDYMGRLQKILDRADDLGMVVILGYFYFGQDEHLENERAVIHAVDNITHWILDNGYRNIIIEINNECDINYDHEILQPNRIDELIERVQKIKKNGFSLLAGTSYSGGKIPDAHVVVQSDFILLHGNGIKFPGQIAEMVKNTKEVQGYIPKPIVFNEDDHYNFEAEDNNFIAAISSYASWGYFDFRMKDEAFENGFQSVPVDWNISSKRKKGFFTKLKEVSGY